MQKKGQKHKKMYKNVANMHENGPKNGNKMQQKYYNSVEFYEREQTSKLLNIK